MSKSDEEGEGMTMGIADEEWVCSVCRSDESDENNPLIICDGCNACVHRDCYGNPLLVKIPDDEWLCDKCTAGCKGESCALCPSTKGAMKRTTDWKWAHLSCSMWIPEVYYRQPDGRDPIDYLQIPAYRWGNTCFYCKSTHGACMQCSHEGCKMMFHITCAMEHGVFLEYKTNNKGADLIHALCEEHAKRWIGKAKKK